MDVRHEDVRAVAGMKFRLVDTSFINNELKKTMYILYSEDKSNISNVHSIKKVIKMFAIPYRTVLLENEGQNVAGLLLYGSADEKEDLASTMEWLSVRNPEWRIDRCDTVNQLPKIIGFRIANNLFHEKRITLHGEILF